VIEPAAGGKKAGFGGIKAVLGFMNAAQNGGTTLAVVAGGSDILPPNPGFMNALQNGADPPAEAPDGMKADTCGGMNAPFGGMKADTCGGMNIPFGGMKADTCGGMNAPFGGANPVFGVIKDAQ
jgi:hypothetical protein